MKCECLSGCLFYNDKMPMDHGIGAIFKKKYCLGNQAICARYQVFRALGRGFVPDNLYPNMLDMAQAMIENANRE